MSFQIQALSLDRFKHLISSAVKVIATKKPGFPCRISLEDADAGEEVLLVHYEHHTTTSPFRSSHAVYVRPNAAQAHPKPNEVPEQLRSRTLSLRAFDSDGMMVEADLMEGSKIETALDRMFRNSAVSYIHIHYAKPGCYAAMALRA